MCYNVSDMVNVTYKLNKCKEEAEHYLMYNSAPMVESQCNGDDTVSIYLMREYHGLRFAEYVYEAKITDGEITGQFKRPYDTYNKPGPFGMFVLIMVSILLAAAVFGVIYLCALLIARNFLLSLYIALPIFLLAAGVIALAVFLSGRKRQQLRTLKSYLQPIIQ